MTTSGVAWVFLAIVIYAVLMETLPPLQTLLVDCSTRTYIKADRCSHMQDQLCKVPPTLAPDACEDSLYGKIWTSLSRTTYKESIHTRVCL